jgi:hypothetical protein
MIHVDELQTDSYKQNDGIFLILSKFVHNLNGNEIINNFGKYGITTTIIPSDKLPAVSDNSEFSDILYSICYITGKW